MSLLKMIEEGEIKAVINEKESMVSFKSDLETFDTNEDLQHIDANIQTTTSLIRVIANLEEQIATSQSYLQKVMAQERHGGGFGGSGGRIEPMEDFLMGDVSSLDDKNGSLRG